MVRREVDDSEFVDEALDPNRVEDLGHIKEHCAREQLYDKVASNSLKEPGELLLSAMFRSETKLLIAK
jgi:hypothetical protein